MASSTDVNIPDIINRLGGWNQAMGLEFTTATDALIIGQVSVGEIHRQPYGIVHGGVHCGIIEAACSTGAAISAAAWGRSVVGLENATSFVRAARDGVMTVTAKPVTRGKRTQVWEAVVTDGEGKTLATGRVRLLCIEPEGGLAGGTATVK